jgi:O-acetyl-ADP-ribose deacetylase (regulator of RNase III)
MYGNMPLAGNRKEDSMTQAERLTFLIEYLISENKELKSFHGMPSFHIPVEENARKRLLRSLMNVRPPKPVTKDFLNIQDEYLQGEKTEKGIISLADIPFVKSGIYLWQGDITRLSVDAIVNAANSAMLGCFVPCHGCIDNAIHSAAGIELRLECSRIMEEKHSMEGEHSMEEAHSMEKQKIEEPTGKAKITKAYNLPCRYVLHTVGPIIYGEVTQKDCNLLSDCYRSCLELAAEYQLKSIAFCCISTGEFHFPNEEAAKIAIQTVKDYQNKNPSDMEVIFNVFKDCDYKIYKQLLG